MISGDLRHKIFKRILAGAILMGAPLLGILLSGKPVSAYLQFPPRTWFVPHAGFSWIAFVIFALLIILVLAPIVLRVLRAPYIRTAEASRKYPFPWWGWLAGIAGLVFWVLAWTRFDWLAAFQTHTFFPLWLSYIVVMNALVQRRTGRSPLTHETGFFLALFAASALFWWFFEYLNRFAQNWHYLEAAGISRWEYLWRASLSFSTVLPAVYATQRWLATFPRLSRGLENFAPLELSFPIKLFVLGPAILSLLLLGLWPDYLFPFLWVSPLAIGFILVIGPDNSLRRELRQGDWRGLWTWSLAAIGCGFFWELWNSASLAKWVYTVPFVQRFQVFEMPLLGYAGYLPFGLECAIAAALIRGAFYDS